MFSVIGVFQKGFADSKSENRTSVIAPTVPISSVRTKAIPEFRFRIGGYSVGTNSNASRGNPVLTKLPIFEKEVDTTLWPAAVATAITQQPATADAATQVVKKGVKPINVALAAHTCCFPSRISETTVCGVRSRTTSAHIFGCYCTPAARRWNILPFTNILLPPNSVAASWAAATMTTSALSTYRSLGDPK